MHRREGHSDGYEVNGLVSYFEALRRISMTADDGAIVMDPHSNAGGYCSRDGEEWPCTAIPPSNDPGYQAAKAYGLAQRTGTEYPEALPRGLQSWATAPDPGRG